MKEKIMKSSGMIYKYLLSLDCLKDESFYDKVKDSILFKTINSQYITLNDYLENCKEKHENKVFYVSNEEQHHNI